MQREKLWTPEFLGMGGSNLFLFMSQYIMVAALPIFIMDTLGGGDMEAVSYTHLTLPTKA